METDNGPLSGRISALCFGFGAVAVRCVQQEGSQGAVQLSLVALKVKVILLQKHSCMTSLCHMIGSVKCCVTIEVDPLE